MILFLIAGFGYGNASRQLATIRNLRAQRPSLPITVFSWGKGYDFLKGEAQALNFDLRAFANWQVRVGNSYALSFVLTALIYILSYPVDLVRLLIWTFKHQPKTVVFDSDYHLPVFLFSKARRISINQAPNIYEAGKKHSFFFLAEKGFLISYLIEVFDFWFQYLLSHKILAPSFRLESSTLGAKVQRVPLIVRQEFMGKNHPADQVAIKGPALILGGSGIDTTALRRWAEVTNTKVFERTRQDSTAPILAEELKSYLPIIVQGGLSSMSECAALGKYMLVVPVAKHWEQFINAREAENLGLAKMVKVEGLDLAINEFYKIPRAALLPEIDCTGVQVICDSLLGEGFHEV